MKVAILLETAHTDKVKCATDVAEQLRQLGIDVIDYAVAVEDNECFEITAFVHVAIDAAQGESSG